MIELSHLFLLVSCIYLIFSNISLYAFLAFLSSAIIFYISFNIGKKFSFFVKVKELCNYKIDEKIGLILMAIGTIFLVLDLLWVRDIPLFNPEVRRFLNVGFTLISRFFILGWAIYLASSNLDKKRAIIYTLIFSAMVMLIGYRTSVIVLLISSIFALYYKGEIKNRELLALFSVIFLIFLLMSIIRLMVLKVSGNPIISRISLTMSVYDIIFNYFNGAFNYYLHYSAILSYLGLAKAPRAVIANFLGIYGVTITPTVVGAVVGDYGTLAIIPYFGILGMFLGFYYMIAKKLKGIYLGVYSVLVGYTLVSIESGILDLDVIFYYFLGLLLCIYAILSRKLRK
ncbi:oligosaccharide repeat unit polymerase family protein [Methanocaldococcus infernus]